MNAEIIAIGTELLLGEIVDTNSAYIARALRDIGLDMFFQTTVGDNEERAAAAISAALERSDVVITTGGLGPTVDDVTRAAVALAVGRSLEFRPELYQQIAVRFRRWGTRMSPNNRRQAYVPAGAIALENPVGTAPSFIVETERGSIVSLPGVPREMVYMLQTAVLPYLQRKMGAPAVIFARVLRTAGIGESQIDSIIQDLERATNPTVGLAAHAGQTDIRITAKAPTVAEAEEMIEPLAREIRQRLGVHIYGEGTETVEEVLLSALAGRGLTLAVAEAGLDGLARERLSATSHAAEVLRQAYHKPSWGALAVSLGLNHAQDDQSPGEHARLAAERMKSKANADVGLAVLLERDSEGRPILAVAYTGPHEERMIERGYGGPPEYAVIWGTTIGFDLLRRSLASQKPVN